MALTQQSTVASKTRVNVDFPPLPKFPVFTISQDQERMQMCQSQFETWYQALKTVLLDKLTSMQRQIDQLKPIK